MLKKYVGLFVVVILIFSLGSCSKKGPEPEPVPEPDFEISEKARVLSDSTLEKLSSYENGRLVFSETTDELNAVHVGDIVVGGISEETPYGFLREVTKISNDKKTIETTQSTLEDLIEKGRIEVRKKLKPSGLFRAMPGVSQKPSNGFDFSLDINNVVLYDADGNPGTTDDQIRANGDISFNYEFYFDFEAEDFTLQRLVFENTADKLTNLELTTGASIDIDTKAEIWRGDLPPFTIWIPTPWGVPLPLVFFPKLAVNVGVNGNISAGITTDITHNANLVAGVSYENKKWNNLEEFSNDFQYEMPSASTTANVKGFAGPQLELLLYDVVGPYGEIDGFARLDVDVQRTPWWKLFGGLEALVGVEVEVLGHSIVDYPVKKVIDWEKLLDQADPTPPPPIASLVANPNSGFAPLEVLLDASGSTGNIVKYIFNFGDNSPAYTEISGNAPDGKFDGKTGHTYEDAGDFTSMVKVVDNLGRRDSTSVGVAVEDTSSNTFTDPRDGQVYKTIRIGNQTWMAENLNYNVRGESGYYNNDSVSYAETYGRIYQWHTALYSAPPPEWHLPTKEEIDELCNSVGGWSIAGGKLKEAGYEHWLFPNTGATNESGFTALPGGAGGFNGQYWFYSNLGKWGVFWTSTSAPDFQGHRMAWTINLKHDRETFPNSSFDKTALLSVRCLKD